MGTVVSGGMGQAPARQAAKGAGLPDSVVCTTVNKVCSSGMKALMYGAQSIALGHHNVVVVGGMESMSQAPYLLPSARYGARLGHTTLVDSVIKDGLWDPYSNIHMGQCAEKTAKEMGITRGEQDEYALQSYARARAAAEGGQLGEEITAVTLGGGSKGSSSSSSSKGKGGGTVVSQDEEWGKLDAGKLPTLRPAFLPAAEGGTITAANASKLNDGAAVLVLASGAWAAAAGLQPLGRVAGYGDIEGPPVDFSTTPSLAIPVALARAGITLGQCSAHEINEAFSSVAIANIRRLGLDPATVNVRGGAVALGHPIGASGARIVGTLLGVLGGGKGGKGAYGTASICNGGGGGSAVVIQRLR
jgi:acetyl-CoA C-acetyltransferase